MPATNGAARISPSGTVVAIEGSATVHARTVAVRAGMVGHLSKSRRNHRGGNYGRRTHWQTDVDSETNPGRSRGTQTQRRKTQRGAQNECWKPDHLRCSSKGSMGPGCRWAGKLVSILLKLCNARPNRQLTRPGEEPPGCACPY